MEQLLARRGIKMDDFLWTTLELFKSKKLQWLDLAVLQSEIEPFGQPILPGFRRKIETHGLDLLIPHYEQLEKISD
jgi:hypothetical protein